MTPLEELRGLATTAGAIVVGGNHQKARGHPSRHLHSAKGKLDETAGACEGGRRGRLIFDNDLSTGPDSATWRKGTGVKVLDRSELILDIFATRARTMEARLQVELSTSSNTRCREAAQNVDDTCRR